MKEQMSCSSFPNWPLLPVTNIFGLTAHSVKFKIIFAICKYRKFTDLFRKRLLYQQEFSNQYSMLDHYTKYLLRFLIVKSSHL